MWIYRAVIIGKCRQYRLREAYLPRSEDVGEALQMIGEHYLALVCDPEVVAMYRVVIAESVSYPKIARLFDDAGPAAGRGAMVGFIEEQAAAKNLRVDDPDAAADGFLCLLRGTHQYDLMLGLRATPDEDEQRRHVERVVRHFLTLYGRNHSD